MSATSARGFGAFLGQHGSGHPTVDQLDQALGFVHIGNLGHRPLDHHQR